MVHPWQRLRALVGWELRWHCAEADPDPGFTLFEERVISIRTDLGWAERRSTVMHECLHAERGPVLEGVLEEREERRVRWETARLMIPDISVLGEVLAWAFSVEEAAQELGVDVGVLRDRLRTLNAAESGYLSLRLEEPA